MTASALSHVLYVDDDSNMRMLVQMTLENVGGIRVTLCGSALELLENAHGTAAQMIILDAVMPDMDGRDLLQAIKKDKNLAAIPVIFLTGRSKEEHIKEFTDLGAVGVIAKPFDLVALPDQVRALWEKSQ